ncbi:MAG TPA: tyrosine-type recombinase/integrase [Tepidisphaeraceae bacterium]
MSRSAPAKPLTYLPNFTARKAPAVPSALPADVPDSLAAWATRYLALAVVGVRSPAVTQKIALHLDRFIGFFEAGYGHDRISTCLRRDVLSWQRALVEQGLAPATVNNHLASLSAFTTWVAAQAPAVFPVGDPAKGIRELGLPPLEPRALAPAQVRSLKNVCDRLERFHRLKGKRWANGSTPAPVRAHGRPWRDRAIVYVFLSTGLRREELLNLNLEQLVPNRVDGLRQARQGRLTGVQGKGGTERTVFLSADARQALADYLAKERSRDADDATPALFLSATGIPARRPDGRLSLRAVNLILEQIGRWHDAELKDPSRHLSPLRPHDLRHTFAFHLAQATGADAYELERRLGHRSPRYIQRYTNPPEEVAAAYVEEF